MAFEFFQYCYYVFSYPTLLPNRERVHRKHPGICSTQGLSLVGLQELPCNTNSNQELAYGCSSKTVIGNPGLFLGSFFYHDYYLFRCVGTLRGKLRSRSWRRRGSSRRWGLQHCFGIAVVQWGVRVCMVCMYGIWRGCALRFVYHTWYVFVRVLVVCIKCADIIYGVCM